MVNRLWKLVFGQGLVTTPDDLGSQGAWPTHPELLDWLARRIHRIRLERQGDAQADGHVGDLSTVIAHEPKCVCADPGNRWLARQNRFRLDAELVRDNALAISGLLSSEIGGPSVKPYQPPGYWIFLNFPKRDYEPDKGENQYRRGLYTYWQRTFLHPSLLAFDASTREECVDQRPRSNTPLQSLVLLNDPTYIEAARSLAIRVIREARNRPNRATRTRVSTGSGASAPAGGSLGAVGIAREAHLINTRPTTPRRGRCWPSVVVPSPAEIDPADLAAWTSVGPMCSSNLHETIARN